MFGRMLNQRLIRSSRVSARARAATFALLVLAAWCVAGDNPRAQQAVFRSATKLVVQTVSVSDDAGNPVTGLRAEDFVLTEDGEAQVISLFEYQRLSVRGETRQDQGAAGGAARNASSGAAIGDLPAVTPSVVIAGSSNGSIRYRDRRLIVLYFDLTALPPADLMRSYRSARDYIDTQRGPADLLALMSFDGGGVKVHVDFTDDPSRLEDALQRLVYGDDLDGDGIPDIPTDTGTAFGQDDAEFNILNTDRQLSALQTAASMLRALSEKKALVYFGSGLRLNGTDNQAQLRATTNAALRANVSIFPIDARGLVASAPLGDATTRSGGGIGAFTGRLAERESAQLQRSQDTLYSLAKDTGGQALFDYNDLAAGIRQAADSMSSYYVLGYYTTHAAPDGKFHRVKIALRDGLSGRLDYREGYFADKEFSRFTAADKERQLEEALMLENPVTDITVAMEVNYFQLNRAEYFVPVTVKIPGSELALARRRGAQRTLIDFIGEIKDDYGVTIQNVRDKLDIKLSEQTASQLASRPVQYDTGFTLLPGNYVIKMLARDSETGRIGTYQRAFTVPNLNREVAQLPISSVVLSNQRVPLTDAIYTVQKNAALTVNPLVFDGQKLVPSVTRVFSRTRDLFVYLQAYQRGSEPMRPMVAFVTIFDGNGVAAASAPIAITDGLDARSRAVPIRFSFPISQVPPGRYDCQVTVLDPDGQKAAFWRAPIAVVP